MKRLLLHILLLSFSMALPAQFMRSYSSEIRSLQMVLNDEPQNVPVMRLNSDDVLTLYFDEMSHAYHRYTYKITHCRANWTQSELFSIDYLAGFDDRPVEEWENSENTTVQYTRYSLTIPNEDVSLKLSGNYMVHFYDDEDGDKPVAEFCFSVVEPRVTLTANVSGNTDIDMNRTHQQLAFTVHHPKYSISNPAAEIIPMIYQNRRLDNCVSNITPTYITGNTLQYVNNKKLIFDAGNEYRRFELTDPNSAGMSVERIDYFEPYYHADLYVDKPAFSHANRRDENGRYFINTLEGYGTSIEADYMFVHFALKAPYRGDGRYFLLGDFCYNRFDGSNMLQYDTATGEYRCSKLLKLGLYNYQYVWLPNGSSKALTEPAEGNFYDTGNEYLILIYHREFGSRYDRLIGYGRVDYKIDKM